MASNFQKSINRASVVSHSNEDKDNEQQKNDCLLSDKDQLEEDNDSIKRCMFLRKCLRAISLG